MKAGDDRMSEPWNVCDPSGGSGQAEWDDWLILAEPSEKSPASEQQRRERDQRIEKCLVAPRNRLGVSCRYASSRPTCLLFPYISVFARTALQGALTQVVWGGATVTIVRR